MDGNNWRAAQGGEGAGEVAGGAAGAMDSGDWRTQLMPDSRQRIVNKIMETLKRHLPVSGQEGVQELKKIAVRFEEKIYSAATSQQDYLRKISLKMLTMETKSQNPMTNSIQPNPASGGQNALGTGSHSMQSQVNSQGQQLPVPMVSNQTQTRQPLLQQNIQNNMASTGLQNSASLTPSFPPPVSNLTQGTMPNIVGQNSNLQTMQNMPNVGQNSVGNAIGQGMPPNMVANSQRQMQGRQQQVASQQQQQQSQTTLQYLYLQQQMMKQKYQPGSTQSLMQSHMQHNSSSGLSTISNSQQHMINTVQPGSSLDLGQGTSLNPLQQVATGSLQQKPVNSPQVNISSLSSQSGTNPVQANLGSLQQNSSVLQQMLQTQQLRQQYQQLQMQQQRFQRQQTVQQQTALLPNPQMSQFHQMRQQMGMKTGVLQQQLLMQQQLMQLQPALQQQMGMKTGVLQQQQSVGQRVGSHHSQLKSGISSPQLHQALSPQWKEKGKVEGDVTLPMEFEPYTSTVEDSSAQTGNANGADWQEGVYQKIKSMREMYVSELNDLYQKIASGMQQAQNKYTLQTPLMGSGPQDMACDGLGYVGKVLVVLVLLLLALVGWVLVLKD